MAIQVYSGKVPTKAEIAIMVQRRNTEISQAKANSWKGKHNGVKGDAFASTKISHQQRRARVIANSIDADPHKNAGYQAGRAVK
jgi:hypothetical protein